MTSKKILRKRRKWRNEEVVMKVGWRKDYVRVKEEEEEREIMKQERRD